MTTFYAERASREDLPSLWAIDQATRAAKADRATVMAAVEARRCYVAKQGQTAVGFAVLDADFFGYPLVRTLIVGAQHRRQGVAQTLLTYLETTRQTRRIFASIPASNQIAAVFYEALGYRVTGRLRDVWPESGGVIIYTKDIT